MNEYDVAIMRLAGEGFSFVVTSHQPNNALLYGDRAALLVDGRVDSEGAPDVAITEAALQAAYGMEFEAIGNGDELRAILPRVVRD